MDTFREVSEATGGDSGGEISVASDICWNCAPGVIKMQAVLRKNFMGIAQKYPFLRNMFRFFGKFCHKQKAKQQTGYFVVKSGLAGCAAGGVSGRGRGCEIFSGIFRGRKTIFSWPYKERETNGKKEEYNRAMANDKTIPIPFGPRNIMVSRTTYQGRTTISIHIEADPREREDNSYCFGLDRQKAGSVAAALQELADEDGEGRLDRIERDLERLHLIITDAFTGLDQRLNTLADQQAFLNGMVGGHSARVTAVVENQKETLQSLREVICEEFADVEKDFDALLGRVKLKPLDPAPWEKQGNQ